MEIEERDSDKMWLFEPNEVGIIITGVSVLLLTALSLGIYLGYGMGSSYDRQALLKVARDFRKTSKNVEGHIGEMRAVASKLDRKIRQMRAQLGKSKLQSLDHADRAASTPDHSDNNSNNSTNNRNNGNGTPKTDKSENNEPIILGEDSSVNYSDTELKNIFGSEPVARREKTGWLRYDWNRNVTTGNAPESSDFFHTIQVSTVRKKAKALNFASNLRAKGQEAKIFSSRNNSKINYGVVVGEFSTAVKAQSHGQKLKSRGLIDEFIVSKMYR